MHVNQNSSRQDPLKLKELYNRWHSILRDKRASRFSLALFDGHHVASVSIVQSLRYVSVLCTFVGSSFSESTKSKQPTFSIQQPSNHDDSCTHQRSHCGSQRPHRILCTSHQQVDWDREKGMWLVAQVLYMFPNETFGGTRFFREKVTKGSDVEGDNFPTKSRDALADSLFSLSHHHTVQLWKKKRDWTSCFREIRYRSSLRTISTQILYWEMWGVISPSIPFLLILIMHY